MLYKLDWLMPKCASLNLIWECFSWANLNADVHREDDKPTLTQVRGLVFNRTPPNLSPTLLSKAFAVAPRQHPTLGTRLDLSTWFGRVQ